jgi:hypothetical protein
VGVGLGGSVGLSQPEAAPFLLDPAPVELCSPGAHSSQLVAACTRWNCPAGHSVQSDPPAWFEK